MSFPEIDSPCPFRLCSLPAREVSFCTRCERRVHNLDPLSETERRALLAGAAGPLCVAYTAPRRTGVAAALAGLGMLAVVAWPSGAPAEEGAAPASPPEDRTAPSKPSQIEEICVIVGGIRTPADARWAEDAADGPPELPVGDADAFLVPAPPEDAKPRP